GAFIIGGTLFIAGRVSKQRDMADLGLHGTEAVVVGGVFGGVLKNFFGRARPFVHPPTDSTGFDPNNWQIGRGVKAGDSYRSFPSGHTVAAFAAAAAVANETSRWWPQWTWVIAPAMYGGDGARVGRDVKPGIVVIAALTGSVADRIHSVQERYDPRMAAELPPHLTLIGSSGMGPISVRTSAELLREALIPVAQSVAPLTLRFDPPMQFMQSDVVVLPTDANGPVRALHEAMADRIRAARIVTERPR